MSLLLNKEYGENIVIVAIGYANYEPTKRRYKKLRKLIGQSNFSIEGESGILVAKIPLTKLNKVLNKIKQIKKIKKVWNCDYTWIGDKKFFDLKNAN